MRDNNLVTFRGPVNVSGTGNKFGVYSGVDDDEVAKSWIKELASTNEPPSLNSDLLAHGSINTELKSPELHLCLTNNKQTLVYEGRPGIGKTTTLYAITRHLDTARAVHQHQASLQPATETATHDAQSQSVVAAILRHFTGLWLLLVLFLGYPAHAHEEGKPVNISDHEMKQDNQDNLSLQDLAQEVVVASIFFNAKGNRQDQDLPDKILMLILLQLIERIPEGKEYAKDLWEKYKTTTPSTDAIITTIIAVLGNDVKACIFLDAVDEYNGDYLKSLLRYIEHIQHETSIGLVISDRIQTSVRRTGRGVELGLPDVKVKTLKSQQPDIEAYLELRMQFICESQWAWVQNQELRQKCKESIVRASGDVFLLVHLNFEFVHQAQDAVDLQYNLDDIEKMPYANGQDTEDYLEQVLSEAYKRNLERILHRDRGRTNVNYARLILAFLRDAIRPLSLEELQCLLQIKIRSDGFTSLSRPSQDIIQAACQGLVNIGPEGSNTIGFIHQSLHRYLEQEKGGKKHIPDESENLGRRCAWFLASDACQEGICIDEKSLETRLKEHPLLNYAARYWKDHLKEFEKLLADNSKEASYDPGTFHALTLEFLLKDAHVESSAQILRFPDKFLAPLIQRPKNSKTVPKQMLFLLVNKDMVAAHNSYQRTSTVGLHLASRHGFQTLVNRILIAEPRQINCIDSDGWTPLHHAAFGGHTPVVRELLHYGAKPDGLKLGISTPLMLATRYNHKETIDVLFNSSRGFDVNMPTQRPDFVTKSFTMATIEVNFDDEVGAPMISGLATEYTQPYGRTLLQTAAREDNIELMERLLQDPQLDKDIQDGDGRTALHTAAKKGKLRAVKLLIERGADHTSRVLCDRYGQPSTAESIKEEWYQNSVLHMAGMYDRGCSVAQYLIQKFPELLNQVNGHREVPLHLAAGNGQAKMVEELLKHTGIDINARDNRGYTPLHLAMNLHGKQWEICIQLLLHYPGVEINTTCDNGETPLATAIRLGRPRYVKLLSEHLNTHPVAPPASVNAESKLNDKTLKEVSLNHPIQEHGVAAHESMSQSNASSSAE